MIAWLLAAAVPPAASVPVPEAASPLLAPAPPGLDCELHVWPSERFEARNRGLLAGFGLLGTLVDAASQGQANAEDRARLGAALDSPSQARALGTLDLRRLLDLPGYRVIRHETPLAPADAERAARHADSASSCYAELIVTRVAFRDSDYSGRSLRVGFLYRDFGAAAAPRWRHEGGADNLLGVWPPQHPNEAAIAADELVTVFRLNLEDYARDLRAARRRR
jgi:hypothetical protein